ncbi:MAG: SDR family oxidoreductase [Acidimicrobiia bacterium]|nr:SDR family oxidoreductase [Acidimicrobiia bacterium]MBV8984566.1 SDR family oxidoreductase [Acidimicrobiia bacterium]
MDLGIAGKVALVTASSKGLGRASALALADEGCKVVVTARGEEALRQTEKELAERTEVLAITEDVTQPDAPKRLVEATVDRFGGVDILVPNAGGPPPTLALEFDDEQLAAALNANLITSIRLVREAVPHMCANKWGRICCITSSSIKQPIPTLAMSNVARTALWAWIKTAAQELFPDGITINTAAPGSHATDRMKQLGGGDTSGMGNPADFGKVVAFLCSQPANFITGTALQVDGGATVGLL